MYPSLFAHRCTSGKGADWFAHHKDRLPLLMIVRIGDEIMADDELA